MDSIWAASILLVLLMPQCKRPEHITKLMQQGGSVEDRFRSFLERHRRPLRGRLPVGTYAVVPGSGLQYAGAMPQRNEHREAGLPKRDRHYRSGEERACLVDCVILFFFFFITCSEKRSLRLSVLLVQWCLQGKRSWTGISAFLGVTSSTENYSRKILGRVNGRNGRGRGQAERSW